MRRIARILLDDPTSLFRLPEGYPNFIPGDPSFYCPYEANPIYTSLTVTATYSGSRTKTIDNIVSKAITTIVYSGSVSWTWNRVYPSNYNNYDYNLFLTDPTMPARADEAYFGLGVSHDLSDDMNHLFGLINPKRQTLILQRGGYEGSPPLVVVNQGYSRGGYSFSPGVYVGHTANFRWCAMVTLEVGLFCWRWKPSAG